MKKRLTALVCALALLFAGAAVLPQGVNLFDTSISVSADEEIGDFTCFMSMDKATQECNVWIRKYNGNAQNLVIPEELTIYSHTLKVYGLDSEAFKDNTSLRSVTMPSSLRVISSQCFEGCSSLKTVSLNEGLETIWFDAFKDCTALSSVAIPSSVTSISDFAFYNTGLEEFTLPSTVTDIGLGILHSCQSLKKVTLPDSLEEVPDSIVQNCTALTTVNIPKNCKKMY